MKYHWRKEMHVLDVFYNKYYLPTVINKRQSIRRNKNENFSLLTPNCMGGYIYHQLGLPFQSPTINLMILQKDFFRLIHDLPHYLEKDFTPCETNQGEVPIGFLGDVKVHFTHYSSFEEGVEAWEKRSERVDFDNLYIIASDRDGIIKADIAGLGSVKCKKLICFTATKYDYPYCFQVKQYAGKDQIGNIIGKTIWGRWKFEQFFDYVAWLNSEDTVAEHFRR